MNKFKHIIESLFYIMKYLNNSSNIIQTNSNLSTQLIEHKKDYDI
jgi:hypothetical protein